LLRSILEAPLPQVEERPEHPLAEVRATQFPYLSEQVALRLHTFEESWKVHDAQQDSDMSPLLVFLSWQQFLAKVKQLEYLSLHSSLMILDPLEYFS